MDENTREMMADIAIDTCATTLQEAMNGQIDEIKALFAAVADAIPEETDLLVVLGIAMQLVISCSKAFTTADDKLEGLTPEIVATACAQILVASTIDAEEAE